MSTLLVQVALPFFVGLLAGQTLTSRSPASRWAHLVYGIGSLSAIWVLMPNPFDLPPVVTVPGLLLGVFSGLFDVRRLITPAS